MKSILLSRQPQIVENVLNGKKKEVVCKRFPKHYVGWVYIYCTKRKPYLCARKGLGYYIQKEQTDWKLNGTVVARFWCYDVNKCRVKHRSWEGKLIEEHIEYVVYFSRLEVFDRPRELGEFYNFYEKSWFYYFLSNAPRNYCYIESEE